MNVCNMHCDAKNAEQYVILLAALLCSPHVNSILQSTTGI